MKQRDGGSRRVCRTAEDRSELRVGYIELFPARIRINKFVPSLFITREAATALNAAACQKFSAAAKIDALATEYLEQQIGATLLAKAIAVYREKIQDPLLKLAGQYFCTPTCGA